MVHIEGREAPMSEPKHVNAIFRAVSILSQFTANEPVQSAAVIARKTGLPTSTTRRIMNTLSECGLLDRNDESGKYSIGASMYILGSLYLLATDIFSAAQPVTAALNELTGETVSVSVRKNRDVVLVMKEEPRGSFRLTTSVGTVIPAYATAMGKALLCELSDGELDALYPEERFNPVTMGTVVSKQLLKAQLAEVRRSGVAFSSEESYEGVEAIASSIRDHRGACVAAMSVTVPVFRMSGALRERLSTIIRLSAALVSRRLGYRSEGGHVNSIDDLRALWNEAGSASTPLANGAGPSPRGAAR